MAVRGGFPISKILGNRLEKYMIFEMKKCEIKHGKGF
jgi:hypothetical protein